MSVGVSRSWHLCGCRWCLVLLTGGCGSGPGLKVRVPGIVQGTYLVGPAVDVAAMTPVSLVGDGWSDVELAISASWSSCDELARQVGGVCVDQHVIVDGVDRGAWWLDIVRGEIGLSVEPGTDVGFNVDGVVASGVVQSGIEIGWRRELEERLRTDVVVVGRETPANSGFEVVRSGVSVGGMVRGYGVTPVLDLVLEVGSSGRGGLAVSRHVVPIHVALGDDGWHLVHTWTEAAAGWDGWVDDFRGRGSVIGIAVRCVRLGSGYPSYVQPLDVGGGFGRGVEGLGSP